MSTFTPLTIAITGATGLVGQRLADALARRGHHVRALVRGAPSAFFPRTTGIEVFRAELPDRIDPSALVRADVLIHAAYSTRPAPPAVARRTNVDGSLRLFELARELGVGRRIFVSSLSARAGVRSLYADTKRELEAHLDPSRDLVLHLGLVLDRELGLFSRIARLVDRSPVLPMFGDGKTILQVLHVDDLTTAVIRAVERGLTGQLALAEPEGMSFAALLHALAEVRGRPLLLVPLPARPLAHALDLGVGLRLPVPFSGDNVRGLVQGGHVETRADLARLDLHVRTALEALRDLYAR